MTSQALIESLAQNPFVLAPMAGITDRPFRTFMREMGCGAVITELVSATGLKYNSEKTRALMEYDPVQRPIGIQIFGEDLESLAYGAREVEAMGADFVDLNFGCPVPKVVKKGAGAALLRDLGQLRNVLQTVRQAVAIPVTIKIRTGWDLESRNAHEVVKIAAEEGITWVAIHGRTRAQGYSGQSDWDYIRYVKSLSPIPVLGNGDIHSASTAVQRLQDSGCDGVMIGRGCLKNPWIFSEAFAIWSRSASPLHQRDYNQVLQKLIDHLRVSPSERFLQIQVKKFAAWYSSGLPDSAAFRKRLFAVHETSELVGAVFEYFGEVGSLPPQDTSHEPFLMGGHG